MMFIKLSHEIALFFRDMISSQYRKSLNRRYCSFFFLFFQVVFPVHLLVASDVTGDGATVLIYHHFGRPDYPTTNVSVADFAEQMEYLKKENYRVIPLAQLVAALKGKEKFPDRSVVITIDDGYRTIYDNAWPILKKYNYPFTVFLYVEGLEKKYSNYLTWDQVKEMQLAGVDFQDHSYYHQRLADRPPEMTETQYREWIRSDLQKSAEILTQRLGYRPKVLAYPYGEYNAIVKEVAVKAGYEAICTQDAGSVSQDTDPLQISREPILGKDWTSLDHFATVLERVDLPFTESKPHSITAGSGIVAEFSAHLLYPDRYDRGSLGIYVSELGWQPARLDGNILSLNNNQVLSRHVNRVAVSGREKKTGKTAIRFWMLTAESPKLNK